MSFAKFSCRNDALLRAIVCLLLLSCYESLLSSVSHKRFECRTEQTRSFTRTSKLSMSVRYEMDMDAIPVEILDMLQAKYRTPEGLATLLPELFSACRTIGTALRDGVFTADKTGTENPFGDQQLDVDVRADKVIFDCLKRSGVVHVAASEENPLEIDCNYVTDPAMVYSDERGNDQADPDTAGYSVAFDPLDGSSIVDANFAVGTIAGIWPGKGLLNRKGKEQVASLICVYGPKVSMALALSGTSTRTGEAVCVELTMSTDRWLVTNKKFQISRSCNTFAPGNLKATADNSDYKALVNYWIDNKYTLRYSGGLVPDIYHILIKGQGVISNASSRLAKAKLRLLFEAAPIALIVEAAGGSTCVCATESFEQMDPVSLLEVEVTDLDRRVGLCVGSTDEVSRFKSADVALHGAHTNMLLTQCLKYCRNRRARVREMVPGPID